MVKHGGLFFLIMVSISIRPKAQIALADSLENLLKSTSSVVSRVDLLNDVSYAYSDLNDTVALRFGKQALAEAISAKYIKGTKVGYNMVGQAYYGLGEFDLSMGNFKQAARIDVPGERSITIDNYNYQGNIYRERSQYDSAVYCYRRALKIFQQGDNPSLLVSAYRNLASVAIIQWRNDEALDYLQKAESLIDKKDKDYGYKLINTYVLYGMVYANLLQHTKTREYFDKVCSIAQSSEDNFNLIKCNLNRADFAYRRGDFAQSIRFCFDALKLTEKYHFPPQLATVYTKIGDAYAELSQFDLASNYYFQALRITEKLKLRYQTAILYSELAWINKEQFNLAIAMDFIDRSQEIRREIDDQDGISNCLNVRGLIYFMQKKYDSAIIEFEKSLEIRKEIGHVEGVGATYYNLALVYEELNQLDKALMLQKEAIAIDEQSSNKQSLGVSYNGIASLLIKVGRLTEAEKYLQRASHLVADTKSKLLKRDVIKVYATLFEGRGDFRRANDYRKKYQELNDSIYSEGSSIKLAEMQALYQMDKKEQEVQFLNQEKQINADQIVIQQAQLQRQNMIIVAAAGILVLILSASFVGYLYYRDKSKSHRHLTQLNSEIYEQKEEIQSQAEELIEANQTIALINKELEAKVEKRTAELKQAYKELDTFFYRSSHDFRRPLTTFLGLAEVAKITVKDVSALELFDKVRETAHNLDKMLVKLQSISDLGTQHLVYKEVFLRELVEEIANNYQHQLAEKGIAFRFEVSNDKTFFSYPAMIRIILENLIENAVQFSGVEDPYINISARMEELNLIIEITDNGQGIHAEYHPRIFDMYFRANEHSKGNGLGLYIVKKAVEKLSGTISFQSKYGYGCRFSIAFPRDTGT